MDNDIIVNINPYGSAEFWFDGNVSFTIDNGVYSTSDTYIGSSDYWYQGTPTGYLQGGRGQEGDSDPNLFIDGTISPPPPEPPISSKPKTRAYAVIL